MFFHKSLNLSEFYSEVRKGWKRTASGDEWKHEWHCKSAGIGERLNEELDVHKVGSG